MGLLDQIREDIKTITTNTDDFAVAIKLTAPTGQIVTVKGLHRKIHLGVDTDGNMVSSRQAHISFSEAALIAANSNYPLRSSTGNINLIKHKVDVVDSTGISKKYVMQTIIPDETVGLIACILEERE